MRRWRERQCSWPVISLCIIAVWCFMKERLAIVGVVCLAVNLLMKPYDSDLMWLCFLLAGAVIADEFYRRWR